MDPAARILAFVKDELLYAEEPTTDVTAETNLLDGLVDSMGLMRLVSFLEEEFEIQIDDLDITEENFRTVAAVALLVGRSAERKR